MWCGVYAGPHILFNLIEDEFFPKPCSIQSSLQMYEDLETFFRSGGSCNQFRWRGLDFPVRLKPTSVSRTCSRRLVQKLCRAGVGWCSLHDGTSSVLACARSVDARFVAFRYRPKHRTESRLWG